MIRIIYLSQQARPLSIEEFDRLCFNASEFNRKVDISGLLLSNGKEFMQCIEGGEASVKALYSKIQLDVRHRDIRLLFSSPVSGRIFDGWSMQGSQVSGIPQLTGVDSVYRLLDHRLQQSWRSLGDGAVELIGQYARVKQGMEAGTPPA